MAAEQEKKTRVPPNSKESEMMVLGCMLTNINALNVAADSLNDLDFYYTEHQTIYSTLKAAYRADKPADIHIISEELKRQNKLDGIGGVSYLTTLAQYAGTSAFIEEYIQLVREKSILRRMVQTAQGIEKVALEEPPDVLAALDQAQSQFFQISQENQKNSGVSIKDLITGLKAESKMPYLKELQERQQKFQEKGPGESSITGIPTHFIDLDKMLNGFNQSNLMILAARPSMGKCVVGETPILDPETGALTPIKELVENRRGSIATLGSDWKLKKGTPTAFVADGIKPTFKVTTALGKEVEATAVHPLLTISGWKRVEELQVGDRIAIPRELPFFGKKNWPAYRLKIVAYLIADGNLTNRQPRFTNINPKIVEDFKEAALQFGPIRIRMENRDDRAPTYAVALDPTPQQALKNSFSACLEELGLMGKNSHEKFVPKPIFELCKEDLSLFINRLFSCDGTAYVANCGGRPFPVIAYSSVSKTLIYQLQHLLLRFGIISKIRPKKTSSNDKIFDSFELEIHAKNDLIRFCQEIGIHGKEEAVNTVLTQAKKLAPGWTKDSLPIEIWNLIQAKKGNRGWSSLFKAKGLEAPSNMHDGKRAIRRDTLAKIAHVLEDAELMQIASSDVYWDRITQIAPTGSKEVYDLSVAETHNFVAGDLIVHNTAIAINLAENICFKNHVPVGFFSLEMGASQILHRVISSQAEVESEKIQTGSLSGSEYQRVVAAVNMMQKDVMVIDDQPGLKITDIRARARRMKEAYNIGFIVIDYLQLISGSGGARGPENRQTEISEISRMLKNLARELNVPILCAAQLSRKVEERQGHRPMLSDLRESGCLSGDTLIKDAETGQLHKIKDLADRKEQTPIQVFAMDENLQIAPHTMSKVFYSGKKKVFELKTKSGRTIKASANHPFYKLEGWTRLDQMKVGDRIAIPRELDSQPSKSPLEKEELVLLGHLLGDGLQTSDCGTTLCKSDISRNRLSASGIYWDEISSITELGIEDVYDATVPGVHNFVANDFIVHNSIEQDADVVMMLFRRDYYDKYDKPGMAEIIVAKNRHGPVGDVQLAFRKEIGQFNNYSPIHAQGEAPKGNKEAFSAFSPED